MEGFEIERKYLIRMPDPGFLQQNASPTEIVQTYLLPPATHINARVRKRGHEGAWVYTHTEKTRLSDLRRIENEREISLEEYETLLQSADPGRNVIRKTRWVLPWNGQNFEIDIFPFWTDRALMELELEEESQAIDLPPQIRVLREVTADYRYLNSSLSRTIPFEEIEKG